jgi:hypothetical protein
MNAKVLIFLVVSWLTWGCKKEEVLPTGSASITYTSNLEVDGYFLYTEGTYGRAPSLRNSTITRSNSTSSGPNTYRVTLEDLNPGTYVIVFTGVNAPFVFQITAGRQRDYSFR